jgi:hypothetical protein
MARIALFDSDDHQHSRLIVRHASHVRHSGLVEIVPNVSGANQVVLSPGSGTKRRRAGDDRIVAVHESLDFEHRLAARSAGVVTGEFAERPFGNLGAGYHFTFDRHL